MEQTNQEQPKYDFPTEEIELPSKGLVYPKDNPLSSGKITIKYMGAKEEDILTNETYINKNTVLDKLMQSVIVSPVKYEDIIAGDMDSIMVAARILGLGKKYEFIYNGQDEVIDLTTLENKKFDESLITPGVNEFSYTLPNTENIVTFKILTNGDERKIKEELAGLKKLNKDESYEIRTRLKYIITSVNGDRDNKVIRDFVDKKLLSVDSRELRKYIKSIQPGVDLTFFPTGREQSTTLPLGISFFWPDFGASL